VSKRFLVQLYEVCRHAIEAKPFQYSPPTSQAASAGHSCVPDFEKGRSEILNVSSRYDTAGQMIDYDLVDTWGIERYDW
jgi:hypothetical protein